jgi:hypothetical protein
MDNPNEKIPFTLEFVLNTLPESIAKGICNINGIDYKDACKMYEIRSYDLGAFEDDNEDWDEEE